MERLGSTFGNYRIHQAILVGTAWTMYHASSAHGTRVVYRGVSSTASRAASLWVSDLLPDIGAVIPMFLQQVGRSNEIDHPVVPRILDTGERDGRVYFATNFQEGTTLEEYIRRHGRLEVREAVSLLTPIADGLDYAHSAGLVHGAIGPNMIWVDSSDDTNQASAVLTGFGLDTLLRSYVLTGQRDDAIPDVLYVAPEQLRRSGGGTDEYVLRFSNPDKSADQYALACALYHCVTGHPPFRGETMASLFNAHAHAKVAPAEVAGDRAARAIAVGMAKDPNDRYASCLDLMHTIRPDHDSPPLTPAGSGRRSSASMDQRVGADRSGRTVATSSYARPTNRSYGSSQPRASESRVGRWVGFALVAGLLIVTMVLLFMATSTFFSR